MPLSDIVNVQITRDTQTVSEAGFGTLMEDNTRGIIPERKKIIIGFTPQNKMGVVHFLYPRISIK